jgi:hypothetical protein
MPKQHFHFKLIPPRPTFAQDASAEELAIMKKHSDYFDEQFRAGKLLLYGLVLAQEGRSGSAFSKWRTKPRRGSLGRTIPPCWLG